MTSVNVRRIEERAVALLKKYSLNQRWEYSFPIPLENVIETEVGYGLDVENFGDPRVLGAISPQEHMIYTNERAEAFFKKCPGSYRFTLGHEVGHWDLHIDESGTMQTVDDTSCVFICRETKRKPLVEREADQYAASILMPEDLVRKELYGVNYYNWNALYQLSRKWGVSATALKIRLERLQLLYYCEDTKTFFKTREESYGQLRLRLA